MASQPQIYRGDGQVSPAAPLPEASPAAFGSAIGQGIEQLGSTLEQGQAEAMRREQQRQTQADLSTAMVGLSQFTTQADETREQAREAAPLDASGHVANVQGAVSKLGEQFLGTIANPKVREQIAPEVARATAGIVTDEDVWARGRRAAAITSNVSDAGNGWADQLSVKPDPATLDTALSAGDTLIKGVAGDNPVLADKLGTAWKKTIGVGFARGLIENDPAKAVALLSGKADPATTAQFDALINDPNDKETLLNQAQTALRMKDADGRRQQSEQLEQLHSNIAILKQDVAAGIDHPDSDYNALIARAQQFPGQEATVHELQIARVDAGTTRLAKGWGPEQINGEIQSLSAKGEHATPAEKIELASLKRIAPDLIKTFRNDPDQAAANGGNPPPQVDVLGPQADQGAVNQRVAWAEGYSKAHPDLGFVPYLNGDQLQQARTQVQSGPAAQLQLAATLRNRLGTQRAALIARQVDPNNGDLKLMTGLDPDVANRYLRGLDALKRNPALFDQSSASETFNRFASAIPQELRTPLFNAAKAIAAGTADAIGFTTAPGDKQAGDFNFTGTFAEALQRAAGQRPLNGNANAGTGGFATWNNRMVWLPQTMGGREFAVRVSRAAPADWIAAGGGRPSYLAPNGKMQPVPDQWLQGLKSAPLVTIAPGVYQPLGADGKPLHKADGTPWTFAIGKLR